VDEVREFQEARSVKSHPETHSPTLFVPFSTEEGNEMSVEFAQSQPE
jgi:hypothetical protein